MFYFIKVRCESEDRIIYPTVSRKPVQAQKDKKVATESLTVDYSIHEI